MRKIKFKGKCNKSSKYKGEWVEGSLIQCEDGKMSIVKAYTPNCMVSYTVDEKTVCQSTGLFDKNGKEIFNGDILVHDNNIVGHVVDGVRGYCFDIVYRTPITEEQWALYAAVVNDYGGDVEIIGNIYDKE